MYIFIQLFFCQANSEITRYKESIKSKDFEITELQKKLHNLKIQKDKQVCTAVTGRPEGYFCIAWVSIVENSLFAVNNNSKRHIYNFCNSNQIHNISGLYDHDYSYLTILLISTPYLHLKTRAEVKALPIEIHVLQSVFRYEVWTNSTNCGLLISWPWGLPGSDWKEQLQLAEFTFAADSWIVQKALSYCRCLDWSLERDHRKDHQRERL